MYKIGSSGGSVKSVKGREKKLTFTYRSAAWGASQKSRSTACGSERLLVRQEERIARNFSGSKNTGCYWEPWQASHTQLLNLISLAQLCNFLGLVIGD